MNNSDLPRFFEMDDTYATGAQPTGDGIRILREKVYSAIVNISPVSTRNYLPEEGKLAEENGMDYIHFPVDCSNLRDRHYLMFSRILDGLKGEKVFIHCGGNIKSSNLMHMYNVMERKIDEKESLEMLLKIQNPESKCYDYFKRFGMAG